MRRWLAVFVLCGCLLAGVTPFAHHADRWRPSRRQFPRSRACRAALRGIVSRPREHAGLYQDAYANLTFARDAAEKFIREGLDPGERIGLFTASGDLTVDFTDDAGKLLDALKKQRLKSRQDDQIAGGCPVLDAYQAWSIVHIGDQTDEWTKAWTTVFDYCPEIVHV